MDTRTWEARKKQIQRDKDQVSRDKGKLEGIMDNLEKTFSCSNLEETKALLATKKAKDVKIDAKIEVVSEELEAYDWDV